MSIAAAAAGAAAASDEAPPPQPPQYRLLVGQPVSVPGPVLHDGGPPSLFRASPPLPPGLTLNPRTGEIRGAVEVSVADDAAVRQQEDLLDSSSSSSNNTGTGGGYELPSAVQLLPAVPVKLALSARVDDIERVKAYQRREEAAEGLSRGAASASAPLSSVPAAAGRPGAAAPAGDDAGEVHARSFLGTMVDCAGADCERSRRETAAVALGGGADFTVTAWVRTAGGGVVLAKVPSPLLLLECPVTYPALNGVALANVPNGSLTAVLSTSLTAL